LFFRPVRWMPLRSGLRGIGNSDQKCVIYPCFSCVSSCQLPSTSCEMTFTNQRDRSSSFVLDSDDGDVCTTLSRKKRQDDKYASIRTP
jgi:hypothetical protein